MEARARPVPAPRSVQLSMPPFWKANVALWFAQVEAQFRRKNITDAEEKYDSIIGVIDTSVLAQVSDLITNPPDENKYSTLKTRLIESFTDSEERKLQRLLKDVSLGDRKPSQLLREMRELANNTVGLDTQLLERYLKRRFHNEKPVEVISVDVKNAVPQGDNYTSLVFRVKMMCLTASGRKKGYSLIVKTELTAAGSKEALKAFPVFRTETRIYTTILPMMEELMEEFGDKREKLWPDLLGFKPYNLIAFNDLSEDGYVGAQRRNCLDFNHSKLVLRNLARYHAMSKVLLARGLITADDKGKLSLAVEDPILERWWDTIVGALTDAMVNSWGKEWTEIAERLLDKKSEISPRIRKLAETYDKNFEVLNHGDPWTCNFLFRYMEHEDNFPVSIKFVDYQMGHANSFMWDVIYTLITSTVPSIRRARLDELLGAYQLSLEKNLNIFNYDGHIPTLDDVKSEWKRLGFAHLCFYFFHSFMSAETTQAFDMEKLFTHPACEVVHSSVYTDGKALSGLGDDFKNLVLDGFI